MFQLNTPAVKSAVVGTSIALGAFSLNAQAALTSYTNAGVHLVYSSVSDVTWTKDANFLSTVFSSYYEIIDLIIAVSPTIDDTPSIYNPTGSYSLSANDFRLDGTTTWWGAMAYVNFLNAISFGGSSQWYLPTVVNDIRGPAYYFSNVGYNVATNGMTKGYELTELFYQELGGSAGSNIPDTPAFDNEQYWSGRGFYWTGTESFPDQAWHFLATDGRQDYNAKITYAYAWAVSPGQVVAVPEPEFGAMLLLGLGVVGGVVRRRKQTA